MRMKTTLSFLCDILLQEQIVNDAQRHGAGSIIVARKNGEIRCPLQKSR